MITNFSDLLLFVHKRTEETGINRLWLIEATMEDPELQLLHQAANYGYILLTRQVSSGSEYLNVELTPSGRAKLPPQLLVIPARPESQPLPKLWRWLSHTLAWLHNHRNPAHH